MDNSRKDLFPGQKSDEDVVLFVRRHIISFLPTVILTFFMMILPIVILAISVNSFHLAASSNIFQYFVLGASAYVLFILTFFIVNWIDYYFDILIITDSRLVNIEQNGLFSRHISQVDLLRVQDVSTSVKGIIPTMFDYGSLVVKTAGESNTNKPEGSDFTMEAMPRPHQIAQTILRLNQELISSHGQTTATTHGEGEIHPSENPQNEDQEPKNFTDQSNEPIQSQPIENRPLPISQKDEGQLSEGETVDL